MGENANHTAPRNGHSAAVCHICDGHSRHVAVDDDGEPRLDELGRGWSQAPYPADFVHRDGSVGSTYTCPGCNARLRRRETLQGRRVAEDCQ